MLQPVIAHNDPPFKGAFLEIELLTHKPLRDTFESDSNYSGAPDPLRGYLYHSLFI